MARGSSQGQLVMEHEEQAERERGHEEGKELQGARDGAVIAQLQGLLDKRACPGRRLGTIWRDGGCGVAPGAPPGRRMRGAPQRLYVDNVHIGLRASFRGLICRGRARR